MKPVLLGTLLSLAVVNQAARADVIEIGADGVVAIRSTDPGSTAAMVGTGRTEIEAAPDVPAAALTGIEPPIAPMAYQASLTAAADAAHLSPSLLAALVWQESRWEPKAVSPRGARGLTQLMPQTAQSLAVDPGDVTANLSGGARYLRRLLDMFDGNVERALAAYNAGPARLLRSPGIPAIAETRAYVASIMKRLGGGSESTLIGAKP